VFVKETLGEAVGDAEPLRGARERRLVREGLGVREEVCEGMGAEGVTVDVREVRGEREELGEGGKDRVSVGEEVVV